MIGGDGRSLQPSSVLCVLLLAGVVCTASGSLYQHLHSYQQRHRGGSSATCTLNSQLVAATIVVATTSHPTHLHLVFQDMPDSCLVEALWDVGVGVKLMEIREWRESLSQLSYLASSQHLLVGNLTWLTHTMRQVHPLYSFSKINALKTHWLWVATDVKETLVYPPSYTFSPSSVFSEALLDVSDALVEGMRGLLIATSSRNRFSGDPSVILPEGLQTEFLDTWVMIGGVDAPGDGSWRMRLTATMTSSGLKVFSPLWPDPPTNFHLRPFRIACIKKPKVFEFDDGDSLEDAGGYIVEMMHVLRQHFNFSGLLVPTEGFGLLMPNGSWNGMVGVLQRREADMAALDFTPSWARTAVVDFSLPIGEDIVVIISRAPSVIIRPFLLLQIFSPFVWACIIGMALMVGVVLGVVTWAEGALSSSAAHARLHVGIMEHTTNVLKIHIAQGSRWWPRGTGGRVGAGVVILVALVIASLYSGSITAFLAIPFRSPPLDSVEDLVRSEVRPALRSRTLVYQTLTADGGALAGVRGRVGVFTDAQTSSWEFFSTVADGTFALVDVYSSAVGRANRFERRGDQCKFYLGKVPVKVDLDVFAFAKNSPILYQFNQAILGLLQHGVIQHIKRKYYSVACEAEVTSRGPQPMNLIQVQGALYVLLVGLSLALLSLITELLWHRRRSMVNTPHNGQHYN